MKVNLKSDYIKTIMFLILMMVSVFAFWYGLRTVLKTEYPLLAVASGSMTPTLEYGDLVLVQGGLNACNIKAAPKPEGDIIVFRNPDDPDSLVVQRAIANIACEGTLYFAAMGDNINDTVLQTVSEMDVIGRVVGKVPLLGRIFLFMQTSEGTLVIIVMISIFMLIGHYAFSGKNKLGVK